MNFNLIIISRKFDDVQELYQLIFQTFLLVAFFYDYN